mmetsp:Transcript_52498/g.170512  ORF Transcript_52498/g.170512 Transcript_52498/m.170512 type:complete len:375 (+) Transcript_52498:102-1226(+)
MPHAGVGKMVGVPAHFRRGLWLPVLACAFGLGGPGAGAAAAAIMHAQPNASLPAPTVLDARMVSSGEGALLQKLQGRSAAAGQLPRSPEFFAESSDDVMPGTFQGVAKQKSCTPECTWACAKPECQAKCKPICRAPVCQTACRKPDPADCKQVCEKHECSVHCKPGKFVQCETGSCPDCETVCQKPKCRLDCGHGGKDHGHLCRSTCADPQCAWDCVAAACPEPDCKMTCGAPKFCGMAKPPPTLHEVYAGHDDNTLDTRNRVDAQYANREVVQEQLASVPVNGLVSGSAPVGWALQPVGPLPVGGAQPMDGALPLDGDPNRFKDGVQQEASVNEVTNWVVPGSTPALQFGASQGGNLRFDPRKLVAQHAWSRR